MRYRPTPAMNSYINVSVWNVNYFGFIKHNVEFVAHFGKTFTIVTFFLNHHFFIGYLHITYVMLLTSHMPDWDT